VVVIVMVVVVVVVAVVVGAGQDDAFTGARTRWHRSRVLAGELLSRRASRVSSDAGIWDFAGNWSRHDAMEGFWRPGDFQKTRR
jgi:hypothetical protein